MWILTDLGEHQKQTEEIRKANTLGVQEELETKYGVQYTSTQSTICDWI